MNQLVLKLLLLFCLVIFSSLAVSQEAKEKPLTPQPVFQQKFDWLKLSSDEWLKGEIVSMYDETLEFDSEELDLQTIDWEDVSELRSKNWQSIRLTNGGVVEGYLVIENNIVGIHKGSKSQSFAMNDILSIAASSQNEIDLWDGYADLGFNLRRGNTVQLDYTFKAGVRRRSSSGRFQADYLSNYSKFEDKNTKDDTVTANSHRLTSTYDWFFDPKIYFRATDFEVLSDEFLNINYRVRYGVAMGYHLIDSSKTSWDVNAGPSYQVTQFDDVDSEDSRNDKSFGLTLGTDFSYEVTSDIDYDFSYNIQIVNEASGQYIHHLDTGLEIDLSNDFDLDLTFYADRTQKPKADGSGGIPEKNDYRIVVSLGYDF
jgi:hypothetical protein